MCKLRAGSLDIFQIIATLTSTDAFALQGTRQKQYFAQEEDPYRIGKIGRYDFVHWHATGVSIGVDRSTLHELHPEIFTRPIMDTQQDFDAWMILPRRFTQSSSSLSRPALPASQVSPASEHCASKRHRARQQRPELPFSHINEDRYFKKIVCKNVSNIEARLRAVEGIIHDAVAAKADLEERQDMLEAGLDYAEAVQQKWHELKKAHLYIWSALVKRLIRRKDLCLELLNMLKQHLAAHSNPRSLAKVIKFCTAKLQRNNDKVTITVAIKPDLEPMWELIKAWIISHGGSEVDDYEGPPPRGPWIRRLDENKVIRLDSCDFSLMSCMSPGQL